MTLSGLLPLTIPAGPAPVAPLLKPFVDRHELAGRRYLSQKAFKELTTRQTPPAVPNSYGLGFSVGPDRFGHGGAHATNMEIYPKKGLVIIWMLQHGGFQGKGGSAQGIFKTWALKHFGK